MGDCHAHKLPGVHEAQKTAFFFWLRLTCASEVLSQTDQLCVADNIQYILSHAEDPRAVR